MPHGSVMCALGLHTPEPQENHAPWACLRNELQQQLPGGYLPKEHGNIPLRIYQRHLYAGSGKTAIEYRFTDSCHYQPHWIWKPDCILSALSGEIPYDTQPVPGITVTPPEYGHFAFWCKFHNLSNCSATVCMEIHQLTRHFVGYQGGGFSAKIWLSIRESIGPQHFRGGNGSWHFQLIPR